MFTHPEILFDLSRQRQSELIEQAHDAALVRAVQRGRRAARHSRRNAAHHRDPGEIHLPAAAGHHRDATAIQLPGAAGHHRDATENHLPGASYPAGSLVTCGVSVAEPAG
jgi:hypothetical protein